MSWARLVRCPVPGHGQGHGDRAPSLLVSRENGGRLRVHCFAGCAPQEVLSALGGGDGSLAEPTASRPFADRSDKVRRVWEAGQALTGTPAETYLRRRGLEPPPVSPALRYHPAAWHPDAPQGASALVAALTDPAGTVTAVQRLFLTRDGRKAPFARVRMALGPMGRGAVQLAPASDVLGLAEGIETAMAASHLFDVPVWAACGARLHRIALPREVRQVILFADNDGPGLAAARKAEHVFRCERRKVEIRAPETKGRDWADVLLGKTARASSDVRR